MSVWRGTKMVRPSIHSVLLICLICFAAGCTSSGARPALTDSGGVPRHGITMTCGKDRPVIDGIGWVMGLPGKILLWDSRVENHHVSEDTAESVAKYLESHGLSDVHVRINEYSPKGEWERLRANRSVGAGWRYTVGLLSLAGYTVIPGRLFGGDRYNPYTNTLYVYSDVPSIGIVESAYAYDVHQRTLPGTYAFTQEIPILAMYKNTLATRNAINYLTRSATADEVYEGYRILYPRYGVAAGTAVGSVVTIGGLGDPFELAGAAAGHVVGRWRGQTWREESYAHRGHHRPSDAEQLDRDSAVTRLQNEE